MKVTIWHNKNCTTSKKVLAYLESKDLDITIRLYLTDPPSVNELQEVLRQMKEPATYILRKRDKVFKEKFVDKTYSDEEWIKAMHDNPSIIERPVVIMNNKAYLGRPIATFEATFEADLSKLS